MLSRCLRYDAGAVFARTGGLQHRDSPVPSTPLGHRSRDVRVANGLQDDMLDFIQAGPKLRKWYGETDKLLLPKDGPGSGEDDEDDEEEEPSGPREAIVVVGADSELGQLLVMQLVLARAEVRALVKDPVRTKQEFGPYVTPVQGDVNNGKSLKKVMKGARALVIAGAVGQSARAAAALGLEHIVLPSALEPQGLSLGSLFGSPESSMQDASREEEITSGPLRYSIVRFGPLLDQLGGSSSIDLVQSGAGDPGVPLGSGDATLGQLTREDAALVIAKALEFPPGEGEGVVFAASAAGGQPPSTEAWGTMFGALTTQSLVQKTAA